MPSDRSGNGFRLQGPQFGSRPCMPTAEYNDALQRRMALCREAYILVRTSLLPEGADARGFQREIVSWDGGTDSYGRKHRGAWERLAQLMLEQGCDPFLFFRAQVASGRIPNPPQLITTKALERYQQFVVQESRRLGWQLRAQTDEADLALHRLRFTFPREPDEQLWRSLLHDSTLRVSPLWRFCLASIKRLPDVAAEFYDLALDQYLSFPSAYERHWGHLIPSALQQAALQIRNAAGVNAWQR